MLSAVPSGSPHLNSYAVLDCNCDPAATAAAQRGEGSLVPRMLDQQRGPQPLEHGPADAVQADRAAQFDKRGQQLCPAHFQGHHELAQPFAGRSVPADVNGDVTPKHHKKAQFESWVPNVCQLTF